MELCRFRLRRSLGVKGLQQLDKLRLPTFLKHYVQYKSWWQYCVHKMNWWYLVKIVLITVYVVMYFLLIIIPWNHSACIAINGIVFNDVKWTYFSSKWNLFSQMCVLPYWLLIPQKGIIWDIWGKWKVQKVAGLLIKCSDQKYYFVRTMNILSMTYFIVFNLIK